MDTKILNELGFTKGEIKAYLELLIIGPCSVTRLARATNLNRSNLYSILVSLMENKIVGQIIKDKKKVFYAENPNIIRSLWKEKIKKLESQEDKITQTIAELKKVSQKKELGLSVLTYTGKEGLKTVIEDILTLQKDEEVWSFGKEGILEKAFSFYWKSFIKKRATKGIIFKGTYINHKNAKLADNPLTFVKYVNYNQTSFPPIEIIVYKDRVILFLYEENFPKLLFIRNKNISAGLKGCFDLISKQAKNPKKKNK